MPILVEPTDAEMWLLERDVMAARIVELESALREARSMLGSCQMEEPDDGYQASWDRGLAKIDAAIANSATKG